MKINFGVVKKYVADRGFGFISAVFANADPDHLFFHIKTVKKGSSSLANQLAEEGLKEPVTFWFEVEDTPKGQQVSFLLEPDIIKEQYESEFEVISLELEAIWKDINSRLPFWAHQVSVDLLGAEKTQQLAVIREKLEQEENVRKQQLKEQEERERKQRLKEQEEALRKVREAEAEKRRLMLEAQRKQREAEEQKKREYEKCQQEIEDNEFDALIAEMKTQRFTHSKQMSKYIVTNKLGHKYRHISGIVRMEKDHREWDFNGGFPCEIYARLCNELGLRNKNSGARAIWFKSYDEILKKT